MTFQLVCGCLTIAGLIFACLILATGRWWQKHDGTPEPAWVRLMARIARLR